jgi:hypothetical protein
MKRTIKLKRRQNEGLANRVLAGGTGKGAGAVVLCLLGCGGAVKAQQVLAPTPNFSVPAPNLRFGFEDESTASIVPGNISLFQWGPVAVHPHVDYQFSYGTGIQATPGSPQQTVVQTFSPGVLFTLGKNWFLDYTPTLTYYSSSQLENNVGQNVTLNGRTFFEDWALGISQNYTETSAPLVETGAQTDSTSYLTALTASYRFNSSLSLDLAVNQSFTFYNQSAVNNAGGTGVQQLLQSTREWSTLDYINYQLYNRITIGLGAGVTYDNVSGGPNQISETVLARINYKATDKSTFSLHAGVQDQQYFGGGQPSLLSPVFGATISYNAAKFTTITLDAERSVAPAAFQSQITTTSSVTLGLSQRLFERFNLTASGAYTTSSYGTTVVGTAVNRNDDYYSLNTRMTWAFWQRATASVFYQYSIDMSSESVFSFTSSQEGFEIGYRF